MELGGKRPQPSYNYLSPLQAGQSLLCSRTSVAILNVELVFTNASSIYIYIFPHNHHDHTCKYEGDVN